MNITQKLKLRYVVKQKLGDCRNSLVKVGRLGEWPDQWGGKVSGLSKVKGQGKWPDQIVVSKLAGWLIGKAKESFILLELL